MSAANVNLINQFNQPGIFGFGTQDNYLFGGTSFPTYSFSSPAFFPTAAAPETVTPCSRVLGNSRTTANTFSGVYVQDNYRVTRRLTLNLGLRYEPALAWRDTGDRWAQVNLAAMAANTVRGSIPTPLPEYSFPGQNGISSDPGMPKNALNANLKGIAPRIGFALDVLGDGKTSLRGGGGIFYDSRVMGMLSNRFVDEWPFSPQFILSTAGNSAPTRRFDRRIVQ